MKFTLTEGLQKRYPGYQIDEHFGGLCVRNPECPRKCFGIQRITVDMVGERAGKVTSVEANVSGCVECDGKRSQDEINSFTSVTVR